MNEHFYYTGFVRSKPGDPWMPRAYGNSINSDTAKEECREALNRWIKRKGTPETSSVILPGNNHPYMLSHDDGDDQDGVEAL